MLDSMDLERERGITIKAQAVRVAYTASDGETYHLHLIDTPGHVDFSYEVSRSLAACEGALLVVDAAQGVEAQTVANAYAAVDAGLELIPVLNKVDLPGADPDGVAAQVADLLGVDPSDALRISAKTGEGVTEVLEAIVQRIPAPDGKPEAPPRALIFDSEFDQYRGVVAFVRMVDGVFSKGEPITAMQAGTQADIDDIGFFTPKMTPAQGMSAGEVGYVITGIKDVTKLRVGDTLTSRERPAAEALPGYREVRPMVFCGLFPIDTDRYSDLRDALDRLALNDAALSYEPETSDALGFGFRCGFLGLLHMDIVRERLEREYDLELLATTPNVRYEVKLINTGEVVEVRSPTDMPDPASIESILEPYIRATIITPNDYVGAVMELCQKRRGEHVGLHYLSPTRVQVQYDLPLAEIVLDFFDQLKSRSKGYASLDYEPIGNRPSDLVKLDVLLAGDKVDALSLIVHKESSYDQGRNLVERLRKTIPRQQFDVPVQAAIGANVIARETVKAVRKDVTAKLYGGDVTRKKQAAREAEEGQEADEAGGRGRGPAGGVPGRARRWTEMASSEQRDRLRVPRHGGLQRGRRRAGCWPRSRATSRSMPRPRWRTPGQFRGHDGFAAWITAWTDAWEEISAEVTETIPVGDRHIVTAIHSGGPGTRWDRAEPWSSPFLFEVGDDGLCTYLAMLPTPEEAVRARRGARELLGADPSQRQAEPGLDLRQRVLAVGDQQEHLVGWEVTELVLERLGGVVIPDRSADRQPSGDERSGGARQLALGLAPGVVLSRHQPVEPVARDGHQQSDVLRLPGELGDALGGGSGRLRSRHDKDAVGRVLVLGDLDPQVRVSARGEDDEPGCRYRTDRHPEAGADQPGERHRGDDRRADHQR